MTGADAYAALLDAIRADVAEAVRAELRGIGAPRLVALDDAGVARRALLEAERRGELKIHRRGKAGFVERAQLERWIMAGSDVAETDDAANIIALARQRRSA